MKPKQQCNLLQLSLHPKAHLNVVRNKCLIVFCEEVKESLRQCWSSEGRRSGVCDPGGPGEDGGGGPRGGVSSQPAGALSPHLRDGLHTQQTAGLQGRETGWQLWTGRHSLYRNVNMPFIHLQPP